MLPSAINLKKTAVVYTAVMVFCLVFSIIYNQFNRGVFSNYMTYLFLIPALLGVLPSLILCFVRNTSRPGRFSFNCWNSAVATLTLACACKGAFDIAGTASSLLWIHVALAALFFLLAVLCYRKKTQ